MDKPEGLITEKYIASDGVVTNVSFVPLPRFCERPKTKTIIQFHYGMTREEQVANQIGCGYCIKDHNNTCQIKDGTNKARAGCKDWRHWQDRTCKKCGKQVRSEEEYKLFLGCSGCASTLD
jgi:hypothetical protein